MHGMSPERSGAEGTAGSQPSPRSVEEDPEVRNLDDQDGVCQAAYFVPASVGVQAHYAFDYEGIGPKRYLKLWFAEGMRYPSGDERTSWGWVLHDSAVLLWKMED